MKYLLTLLIVLTAGCSCYLYAQPGKEQGKWMVTKIKKGMCLSLDIPFRKDSDEEAQNISFKVVKNNRNSRPDYITISLPDSVLQSSGMYIKFGNTIKDSSGNRRQVLEKAKNLKIPYTKCDSGICKVEMEKGYVANESFERVDVFQKFMTFDDAYILFFYPDKSHKYITVPLKQFQKEYEKLP